MIQESGVVIKVEGSTAWVETQRKTACDSCSAKRGCGNAVIAKVVGQKRSIVQVDTSDTLVAGEDVILGMNESALVKGSFAIYIVPLLLMMLFAISGEYLGGIYLAPENEFFTIITAAIGLFFGFVWLKRFNKKNRCNTLYQPVILRKGRL